jgi:two-component system, cell cycle sensor histidine kinase and response regulator CckA
LIDRGPNEAASGGDTEAGGCTYGTGRQKERPPMTGEATGTVLIVEDDAGVARLQQRRLERAGFLVYVATSVVEALDAVRQSQVDLAVLDYKLPGGVTGLDVLERIRAAGFDVPAILVTGFSAEAMVVQALRAGVRDFVAKSEEYLDYLPEAARRVIRGVHLERQLAESEARLAAVIDSAKDAIILTGADWRITLFNPAAERMFCCRAAAAVGEPLSRFMPREFRAAAAADPDKPAKSVTQHLRAGTRGVRCDGEEFPLEASTSRVEVRGGKFYAVVVRDVTERERAAEALRAGEARYRSLVETAGAVIVSLSPTGRIREWNQEAERLFGWQRQEVLGREYVELCVPEEARAGARADAQQVLAGRPVRGSVGTVVTRHGGLRVLVWNMTPLADADGRIAEAITVGVDVTERREAEEQLIERERQLAQAQQVARLGSWEWDPATDDVRWSEEMYRMFGLSPQDFRPTGKEVCARLHPDDLEAVKGVLEGAGRSGEPFYFSHRLVLPDQTVRTVQGRGQALRDGHGRPVRFTGVAQDVTESAEAQEARRKTELRFRQVWEESLDAMRLTDERGVIHLVNGAYCRLVGKAREALEGELFSTLYAEPERDQILQTFRERFASRTIEPHLAREATLWDGRRLHFQASNSFLDIPGQPPLLLSVIRDVTEQRRLEEQLRQAQKLDAVGRLAGGVAHDFNNLLTVIGGYADFLLEALDRGDRRREYADEVAKAADRAASLTGQLLAFSRKQVLQTQVLDLNDLLRDAEKLLRRLIGEDVTLVTAFQEGPPRVRADAGQLHQVVMNLAVNARDAMPQGGTLTIATAGAAVDPVRAKRHPGARPGLHAVLIVRDTGGGMSREVRDHLFEPFFTTKGLGKGTGLGLATVHGIVTQSGGFIEVESEPGRGSTFSVYLPETGTSPEAEVPAEKTALPAGSETVLLVEDEPAVREYARLALEHSGYRVLVAREGAEALQLAQGEAAPVPLLVTDVVMPGMSGRELAERLRPDWPELRVLYLSGYTDDALVRHGVATGAAFLQKPFAPAALARKVREVLDG